MARRPRSDDLLPAAAVAGRTPRRSGPTVVLVEPPFAAQLRRLHEQLVRAQRWHGVVFGNHRDTNPRLRSVVEHRVRGPVTDVVRQLCADGGIELDGLIADERVAHYDAVDREYRIRARLRLVWSWPQLPMWLSVGELSSTQSALRLSLRSRKRVRYPARYFHAAHAALDGVAARLVR